MGGRIGIFPMPVERSFQIDYPEDLTLLEKLLAARSIDTPGKNSSRSTA
jgi:CMP-N-acetylneuraminic acid synthetase